jgi:hypothetical protein
MANVVRMDLVINHTSDEVSATFELPSWFSYVVDLPNIRRCAAPVRACVCRTQHEWFKQSRSSKTHPKRDWYVWRPPRYDAAGNRRPPNNWRSAFQGESYLTPTSHRRRIPPQGCVA